MNSSKNLESISICNFSTEIDETQAGTITYGKSVSVQGYETHKEYNYDVVSPPTVVCFSIATTVVPMVTDQVSMMKEVASLQFENYLKNVGKSILEHLKIYSSEWCVVSLEENPDTIMVQCGHKCIRHENIDSYVQSMKNRHVPLTCAVCREVVMGFINESGVMY